MTITNNKAKRKIESTTIVDEEKCKREIAEILTQKSNLDNIYDGMKELHQRYALEQRFFQFIDNFLKWMEQKKHIMYYYVDNAAVLTYAEEFCKWCISSKQN